MNRDDIEAWLCRRLAERTHATPESIDRTRTFDAFGLDSMEAVTLSGELEELLGRRLDPTVVWDYPTVARLAEHLATGAGAGDPLLPTSTEGMSDADVDAILRKLSS